MVADVLGRARFVSVSSKPDMTNYKCVKVLNLVTKQFIGTCLGRHRHIPRTLAPQKNHYKPGVTNTNSIAMELLLHYYTKINAPCVL